MIDESLLTVHRRDAADRPQMAETRLEYHASHDSTSNEALFVVHHYEPPPVGADELGRLSLRAPGTTLDLTVAELREFAAQRVEAVIECAGNARRMLRPRAPGTQFGYGLCGVATWEGVRVSDLLAGVDPDSWSTLVAGGLDHGWAQPENRLAQFAKGLPKEKALHPDTLLAWSVNGDPLPHEHGGPLRLVVPGWAGVWWVKWVCTLECTDERFAGFWQHDRYRYVGGDFPEPEVVREQLPRALIVSPLDDDVVAGGSVEVTGRAWSGAAPIESVEVSTDGGASWASARLEPQSGPWTWARWRHAVQVPRGGLLTISARATDAAGARQEWDSRPNALGYGNNGIMSIMVRGRA
jgi:DMSO/TMAO reductase YedYZ molybdopterin-dependent catalytic subunit